MSVNKSDQQEEGCAPPEAATPTARKNGYLGEVVSDLAELVQAGRHFATIYADPPWPYDNEASRAAAVDHYSVMSLADIRREPVAQLAEANAHLHLWTTNAFLREAINLIEAWGFRYRSAFIWTKDRLGMGNYWRVSHEFLLLGVRGKLRFLDRTQRSWILAHRGTHSRKPDVVRQLIEQVSPGPYLELYARAELPNSTWTVYGNEVERRLF
jgi:N6-adenosine-specific RNA methylase IME4